MIEDTWKWILDKSSQFSSKSLSHYLASEGNTHHAAFYKNIWRGPIPKKFRFFQWEVGHGSVNTTDTLIKKQIPGLFLPRVGVFYAIKAANPLCTSWFFVSMLSCSGTKY